MKKNKIQLHKTKSEKETHWNNNKTIEK